MSQLLVSLLCVALASVVAAGSYRHDPYQDESDIPVKNHKTTAERIEEHGYPAESHFVETSDGYVLNMFRIPYSPKLNNEHAHKPVVFLQHGLFSCSDCFILNGADDSIAFNFADAGFDVWMGNARGNIYSRQSTKISLNHPRFWDFSWHEIGVLDVPAMIDFVLETTGETTLHYVGHSQGTTVFFVMGSMLPEYNDKIKTAHMLAPAIFMGNSTDGLMTALAPYVGVPGMLSNLLGTQQFFPHNPIVQRILDVACGEGSTYPEHCETLFLMWSGAQQPNMNMSLLPLLAETHPAGISTNQGIHYIQLHVSNLFRQYDFGVKKNLKRYNQEEPPEYPLEKITTPMYLYYGLSDAAAFPEDVQRLPAFLPNLQLFHEMPDPDWGHLDFVFANQVKEEINDLVLEHCLEYEAGNVVRK